MTNPFELPYSPPLRPVQQRRRRSGSCQSGCLWLLLGGLIALSIPIFLVGLGLMLYFLFPPGPQNVVLMGLDARPGEGFTARTDSIMIAGVQPDSLDFSLLSIPRDLFINTPGYGMQRVNTVNVLGEMEAAGRGGSLLQETLANSLGIRIDGYVRINFDAFVNFVDALGGIDVDVPGTIVDYEYPTEDYGTTTIRFEAGWQHMTGEQALAYARTRHADDDYRRAERQQQVVMGSARAALNPLNWLRLPGAIAIFMQSVDSNLTLGDFLRMTPPVLFDALTDSIDHRVIDRDVITLSPEGYAVPDYAALAPWIDAHLK